MAQIPKGRLVQGPYQPICRDCAMYFSIAVSGWWQLKYCLFSPQLGKMIQFDEYFSDGLKPPTSFTTHLYVGIV